MSKTVGVIGVGFVGSAVARGFNLFADVRTYDIDPNKCTHSFEEVVMSDFVFVCLPTPMVSAEGGECNLSIIEGFFEKAKEVVEEEKRKDFSAGSMGKTPVFVLKSTVPVGTTARLFKRFNLNIVHSPEFLTARSAVLDFIVPARNIVGSPTREDVGASLLKELYEERFKGVPCFVMSSDESEMVKYFANCFFATKVMFFNEMRLLIDKLGLDWEKVLAGVLSDGRIAKSHYQVPGHDGDMGFGGTCFPKDINALITSMEANGIDPLVLKAVWEQNTRVRKNWDWAANTSAVRAKE